MKIASLRHRCLVKIMSLDPRTNDESHSKPELLSDRYCAHESTEVVLSSPESCGSSAGTLSGLRSLSPLTHSSMRLSPAWRDTHNIIVTC